MTVKYQERIDPQIKKKFKWCGTNHTVSYTRQSQFLGTTSFPHRTKAIQILAEMNSCMEVPGCLGGSLFKCNSFSSQYSYASSDKIRYC